jgi:hypothetical protein
MGMFIYAKVMVNWIKIQAVRVNSAFNVPSLTRVKLPFLPSPCIFSTAQLSPFWCRCVTRPHDLNPEARSACWLCTELVETPMRVRNQ